ncbi:Acyl-CoA reductase [Rhodococcus rhodochrous J3]|uniref:Acyl-CoA reductase n=1 Tax=Rhodococcus rhodochrous J3 TaxID=903528 RepID=A0ABY1MKY2_RHORH|nr:aldehyde dehydrogenase [Rhodococcus rhodochrous]MBF4478198.1 aldehyde dehydrogenase [Rhodococcus rhodochrous]MCD2100492.1 aldehyde dehydrogenase [Rhodococcus rhodochrous]MCD2124113.1 aldehyde dehydrogenase [Rhodococcus rhodochrous]MCQ4136802.1 aldehyde dehydrogenase [Rhodococcus rhodochrous]MDJ0020870.1 aldehyde dehydrogenase [Rhodococcus rhodochrous]
MTTNHSRLFIGGQWTDPTGNERIDVYSASTEELIGSVPHANSTDVDNAVAAARRAFEDPTGWSRWTPDRRADVLDRFADEYDKRAEAICYAIARQNGMPITVARQLEAPYPPALLRYYANLARTQPTEEIRPGIFVSNTLVRREPVGVVAAIVPWNVPQTLTMTKLAPALAAGCTIVIKPSPETVLDAYLLAEAAAAAGLPDGVMSIVPGGRELGAYLVSHPGVDKVAFTGSTAGGKAVAQACAALLRPVTLELGGKSAAIILDDAELNLAAIGQSLFTATLANNGQVCFLGTRVLAPRARYKEVVDCFAALIEGAPVGDAVDDKTLFGPMASATQRDRVASYIDIGIRDGARVVTGGSGRPEGQDRGWFVKPTLFADVDNTTVISREEIFGPVLSVIAYDGDEDAVKIANDSDYGLGGSVWSADDSRALAVASAVQSGTVGINGYIPDPGAPFGGIKASGIGREFGPEGLANYQQAKSIYRFS